MTPIEQLSALVGGLATLAGAVIVIIRMLRSNRNVTSAGQATGHGEEQDASGVNNPG